MDQFQNAYIADGFADDCDELIHRCIKEGYVTYEVFCDIWQDMQLGSLYHGRTSGAEIAELSEEVLHIAKHYLVTEGPNIEESVAGLFLVYALLNLQPFAGFASLRLVQEDVPAIVRLELVARRERRLDVLYMLGSVLSQGPVQYHAVLRERGMEHPIRKYLEGYTSTDSPSTRPKGVFFRQSREVELISRLVIEAKRYCAAKVLLQDRALIDPSLNYVEESFGQQMEASMKKIISGMIENSLEDEPDDALEIDDAERAKKIKAKAMTAKVNPMQHLIGVKDKQAQIRSDSDAAVPSTSEKIKSTSPIKAVASTSKPRRNSRRKIIDTSPAIMNRTSTSLPILDNAENDLDLTSFDRAKTDITKNVTAKDIDFEMLSLPCIIHDEDSGKLIELEIIDNKEEATAKNRKHEPKTPKLQRKRKENIANSDIAAKRIKTPKSNENSSNRKKICFNKPRKIKDPEEDLGNICPKPEKRDLKKSAVKSRFKRMGILPVGNFELEKKDTAENATRLRSPDHRNNSGS